MTSPGVQVFALLWLLATTRSFFQKGIVVLFLSGVMADNRLGITSHYYRVRYLCDSFIFSRHIFKNKTRKKKYRKECRLALPPERNAFPLRFIGGCEKSLEIR